MSFDGSLWLRRVRLTGLSPSATLSGFVALVPLGSLPVEAVDGGAFSARTDGGDLRFALDKAGKNQLPLEIVDFVADAAEGNRRCQLVIRFPVYTMTFSDVWVFYGKADAQQPAPAEAFGRNAVYQDREYQYNLYDAESVADSTGASTPAIAGQLFSEPASPFGWGVRFGAGAFLDLGASIGDTRGNFTLRCWVKAPAPHVSNFNTFIATRRAGGGDNYQWRTSNRALTLRIAGQAIHADISLIEGLGYQLAVVVASDVVSFYVNGQLANTPTRITGTRSLSNEHTYIGGYAGSSPSELRAVVADVSYEDKATSGHMLNSEYANRSNPLAFWATAAAEDADVVAEASAQDSADNLAVYYQNTALNRTSELPSADWGDGMNKTGSCAVGIGINTGSATDPTPARYTVLDQSGEARAPQLSQNIGQPAAAINAVQGADVNDVVNYVTATQEAEPDAIYDVTTGTINRTSKTLKVGDTAWGTKDVS